MRDDHSWTSGIENGGYTSGVNPKKVGVINGNVVAAGIYARERDERKALRLEIQGNGKFIMNGSDDRVNGSGYNGTNLEKYPTEDDRKSYHYGYTVHGGKRLMNVVEQLVRAGKYDEIILIAERDYNNGIKEEDLGMVANIPEYLEAYKKIANKNKRK